MGKGRGRGGRRAEIWTGRVGEGKDNWERARGRASQTATGMLERKEAIGMLERRMRHTVRGNSRVESESIRVNPSQSDSIRVNPSQACDLTPPHWLSNVPALQRSQDALARASVRARVHTHTPRAAGPT